MQSKRISLLLFLLLSINALQAQIDTRVMSTLPDQGRDDAVGFAIGDIGYVLGGRKENFAISPQLWAYDTTSDTWSARSPLPASPRQYASTFVLDGIAYVLGGNTDIEGNLDEVWAYDPEQDSWTQKADFPAGNRFAAIAFQYDGQGYYGLGRDSETFYEDVWRYSVASDTWELAFELPEARYSSIAAPHDGRILLGAGIDQDEVLRAELWSYGTDGLRVERVLPFALGFSDAVAVQDELFLIGGQTEGEFAIPRYYRIDKTLSPGGQATWRWEAVDLPLGPIRNGAVFQVSDRAYYFGGKNVAQEKSKDLLQFSKKPLSRQLNIYPQPARERLHIAAQDPFSALQIIDSRGRQAFSQNLIAPSSRVAIDISALKSGVYILSLDGRSSQRLVIE